MTDSDKLTKAHETKKKTNPVQTHVMAASAASDAMSSIPSDAILPLEDTSKASDASVETVSSKQL